MHITADQLEQARQGQEAAQAAVIARMMPAIRRYARQYQTRGLEEADAQQEGLIALFRAIDTYQADREAVFETYATRCIRNGILDARQRAESKKNQPLNHSLPIDEQQSVPGPEEAAVSQEEYRATVRILRSGLTDRERRVLLLYLEGADYRSIARQLQISVKAVDNALTRVRTKLRNGKGLF